MTLRYIDINGFGVLVDESAETKQGDLCYAILSKQIFENINPNLNSPDKCKIVFAEKELNLDSVPILPNWREFNNQEVFRLATEFAIKEKGNPKDLTLGFITGYNHNKAKYTEEDLEIAFGLGAANNANGKPSFKEVKQSLQKIPKYIVMESELNLNGKNGLERASFIPKLIINSEGKQEGIIKEIIY
ncbi:MAG TPA: hypothetical protein PKD00_00510 [Burkholderiales bacterium]|nr:hypothetical protein [Burkholderiales bacterium]